MWLSNYLVKKLNVVNKAAHVHNVLLDRKPTE